MDNPITNPALLSDLATALLAEEAAARDAAASGRSRGPKTGFSDLDLDLGGFLVPGIHVLLAAPGDGKTALALQIAAQCGCPALFVSAEMRPVDLMRRVVARTTGVYLGRLRGGDTDSREPLQADALAHHAAAAAAACPQMAVYDATAQPVTLEAIQKAAQGLKDRFESPHVLLVLDSLTDWAASQAGDRTEYQANEEALNALKSLTAILNCPILVIVHKNRSGQKAEGAAQMFTGKATGRVEYVAESLWSLESVGEKEPDNNGKTQRRLSLLKNRNGPKHRVFSFNFEGRVQRFTEA